MKISLGTWCVWNFQESPALNRGWYIGVCYKFFGSNFVYVIYVLKGTQVLLVALNSQIKVHHKRHISMQIETNEEASTKLCEAMLCTFIDLCNKRIL